MSQQQMPLTAEVVFEMIREMSQEVKAMFQETDRKFQETDRKIQETAAQMKKTDKKISDLGSRIGEIVENMVGGDIVKQFQALNIPIHAHSRDKIFGTRGTEESGQIDVFLENGDIVVLIEVKTKPTQNDVHKHVKRMKKYRLYGNERRRIIGAIAGAVVHDEVAQFAHKKGMYVIVQSGEAVEIIAQPEGFRAKEW